MSLELGTISENANVLPIEKHTSVDYREYI